ncbi:MAG TPA: SO_0444 family Cu/Zn efflux transporter [Candidatus Hydrogenedentes bacterium]|nr:SO_0444 family Cu/Zn efflux transporter [Candidatus Hydrogenedentota bacterium]HPG67703.1 SO_0444 family Cu/Zn efflux transporter [Candidatus Hydrogenedentota bacterium]
MVGFLSDVLEGSWAVLTEMAPYLLFGFLVAGALSVLLSPEKIERYLGGQGLGPVIKASLFGVPLPLCSCGVIPVGASLRRHGASRGATTAFLLSTPQTGVDSILVTYSLLGPVYAVFRPIAAFVTGLIGGAAVNLLDEREGERQASPACTEACCTGGHGGRLVTALRYGFTTLPRDIGKALLFGLLAAGIISALVPNDYFASVLGSGLVAMVAMMLLGIPIYVCATASVPIAAALIAKGVSPGAALVFLMTGPATNAATIAVVWRTLGRRTAAIYLATVAVCALAAGLLLDAVYGAYAATVPTSAPAMLPHAVNVAAAVALLTMLAWALLGPDASHKEGHEMADPKGEDKTILVKGMTCSHCAQAVRQALTACHGVSSADIRLSEGKAVVHGIDLRLSDLLDAVRSAGYEAREAPQA